MTNGDTIFYQLTTAGTEYSGTYDSDEERQVQWLNNGLNKGNNLDFLPSYYSETCESFPSGPF